jgi:hypothetical protein
LQKDKAGSLKSSEIRIVQQKKSNGGERSVHVSQFLFGHDFCRFLVGRIQLRQHRIVLFM